MTREEAIVLMEEHIQSKNLINHCYAVEAIMRGLAVHFGEDQELWGIAGLLHDIDYDQTQADPAKHSLVGGELLSTLGFSEEVVHAVICHNDAHGLPRKSLMDKALYAADPLSGLIVAGALIRPEKKLAAVEVSSLLKRFGEKSFARGARRDSIACCQEMGLSLEEFIGIGLAAMKENHEMLGL